MTDISGELGGAHFGLEVLTNVAFGREAYSPTFGMDEFDRVATLDAPVPEPGR